MPYKAVALISGGLDSLLAVRVVQEQGIYVEGLNFYTGFCVEGHTHAIRKKDKNKPKRNNALWAAEQLGIKLHILDIIEPYKDILLNPKHGYGANMNPCLDCKIFMVKKAHEWMLEHGFDFIITGEVVGQRPKSQRRHTMPIVANESGANDLLVRPLCAKNLPPTKPERENWLKRDRLYGFSGRNRKPQMALAAKFGFDDYASPAGGCCFLTDENYSRKLVDLWQTRDTRDYTLDDIMLLKVGRHLRPAPNYKLIVSREEGENQFLHGYKKHFTSIELNDLPGPLALVDGKPNTKDLELAASIVGRFSKFREQDNLSFNITQPGGKTYIIKVKPLPADKLAKSWYV